MRFPKCAIFFILCFITIVQTQNLSFAESDQVTLTVKTAGIDTNPIDGMLIEIKSTRGTVQSGFSPLSYNATLGATYTVITSDYDNYAFDHWDDGNTNNFRTVQPTSDTFLIAYYRDKSTNSTFVGPGHATQKPEFILPDWLRQSAQAWLKGDLSDKEFLVSLQQLVDQNILDSKSGKQSTKQEGFSNVQCNKGNKHVEMIGKYTNGDTPYSIVAIRMMLSDADGNILASNTGTISNLGAHETRYFNVITRFNQDFSSCNAQIDSVLPK